MKLSFLGAAREVTGSCYLLEVGGKNVLIDCGMAQGPDIYERQQLSVNAKKVDAVLLTHAHVDHSGLLPLLHKNGFRGKIYLTRATRDLACIMLKDCAHIQKFEAEWRNRKAKRSGDAPYVPIYDAKDVLNVIKQFRALDYGTEIDVCQGVKARFVDAGHLLGSASIEVWAAESGVSRKIVFSGDLGNKHKPIVNNPTLITDADYVLTESTYADTVFEKEPDVVGDLARIIQKTLDGGGNVVIPTFAVGRMQELLYYIRIIKSKGLVKGHEGFSVYVDSPLAVEATKIFQKTRAEYFSPDIAEMVEAGENPLTFPGLKISTSTTESIAINRDETPKVILSASGMCEAGRIRHHLKHNLWREDSAIVFVGYQVEGTLGRTILDGAKEIELFGEPVKVEARIYRIEGTSAHADKPALINWVKAVQPAPRRVFVVHGNEKVAAAYAQELTESYGLDAVAPMPFACWDLVANLCLSEGQSRRRDLPKESDIFTRLWQSGKSLSRLIDGFRGHANEDIRELTSELEDLYKKWEQKV